MRLIELGPQFVRYGMEPAPAHHGRRMADGVIEWGGFLVETRKPVESLEEAQGVWFLCPKCYLANGGVVGTHACEVTFEGRGVSPEHGCQGSDGKPTRWAVSGSGFEDLTVTPSIQLIGGCNWHGYITKGEVT